MNLVALSAAALAGLLAAVGLSVLALYSLRERRVELRVAHVHLFDELPHAAKRTRLFARLRQVLSFLLALAIAYALAVSLSDPRVQGPERDRRDVALLIDTSASMAAVDVAPSRIDAARRYAHSFVDSLGSDDSLWVVAMDSEPHVVATPGLARAEVHAALERLRVRETALDASAALDLAADVLRGRTKPEIVIVSDGRFELPTRDPRDRVPEPTFVPVGATGDDLAISAFAARRYPLDKSRAEALVRVSNFGGGAGRARLDLLADERLVERIELDVPAGETIERTLRDVSGADEVLEARLHVADRARDVLGVDDHAFALLPPRRRARVLVVTDGNLYLSAALLLDEYLDVTEQVPARYSAADGYDVVVFDRFVPDAPPSTDAVYLYPERPASGEPIEVAGHIDRPFFDEVSRDDGLLRFVALRDVNIAEALLVRPRSGDRVLGRDRRGPLLVRGRRGAHEAVILTFDVRRSDLPLRAAWPLVLIGIVDSLVGEDTSFRPPRTTGETLEVPLAGELHAADVTEPSGKSRRVPVSGGRARFVADRVGVHAVTAGSARARVVANLETSLELPLTPRDRVAGTATSRGVPPKRRPALPLAGWLIALALALAVVEWLTFHRRWTT